MKYGPTVSKLYYLAARHHKAVMLIAEQLVTIQEKLKLTPQPINMFMFLTAVKNFLRAVIAHA